MALYDPLIPPSFSSSACILHTLCHVLYQSLGDVFILHLLSFLFLSTIFVPRLSFSIVYSHSLLCLVVAIMFFYHAPFPSPPSSMLHLPSSILQPTYSIFFCYRHLRSSHLPYSRGGYGSSSTSSSSYPSPVFTIPPPLRYTTPQPYDLSCQPPSPSS